MAKPARTDPEKPSSEPSAEHPVVTWRVACTFSLLAMLTMIALLSGDWPFTGPVGLQLDFILKTAVWFYIFALCAISVYLAAAAFRRYRHEGNREHMGLSVLALVIAGLVSAVIYIRFWTLQ